MRKYLLSIATLLFSFAFALNVNAQCFGSPYLTSYPNFNPACASEVQVSTCTYGGEYNTIHNLTIGDEYTVDITTGLADFVTITDLSNNVITFGTAPVTFTATTTSIRAHLHLNANCGTYTGCHRMVIINSGAPPATFVPCDDAEEIGASINTTGGTVTVSGTTECYTVQNVSTCGTTLNTAPGRWYVFNTDFCGGDVTVTTCGFDTKLGAFTGDCNNLVCLDGNDDTSQPGCSPFGESEVNFTVEPYTSYYIYMTGWSSNAGDFDLFLTYNLDPCCAAGPLTANFVPPYITVCPGEAFSGTLEITGGLQGPPNGLARAMVSTAGFSGVPGNNVIWQNGDDGSVNSIEATLPPGGFRAGGAIIKEDPANPPVPTDPMYFIDGAEWNVYQNGVETLISSNLPATSTGNAWDPIGQQMYLSTAGYPGALYTIDHLTGATTYVGDFNGATGFAIWIVVDNETGDMYMFDIADDNIYQVDKATGNCTLVGSSGIFANYGQDAYFWDGKIYSTAFNSGTFSAQYGWFDITTGAFNLVQDYGFAQLGAQAWVGQTFPGGYDVQWDTTVGLTQTGPNWSTFDGILYEPGIYVYNVTVTDACGATTTAQLIVEVLPAPDALACNDHVTIAVYDDCLAEIRADMFLEGPYDGCYHLMEVYIWPFGDESLSTPDVNNTDFDFDGLLNVEHMFVVYNPLTGNQCMGSFVAEDKMIPQIDCGDEITVACYEATPYIEPLVDDNCDNWFLDFEDEVVYNGCADYTYVVYRTWTVFDMNNGLSNSCVQVINKTRADLADLTWPLNWDGVPGNNDMIECNSGYPVDGYGNPHPDFTGWPGGVSPECGTIEVFYADVNYTSNCGPKILREWTVIDDCTATIETHVQIIRITDTTIPTFMDGETLVANTKGYVCNADFEIPAIMHLEDNCDPNPQWFATTNAGFIVGDENFNGFVDPDETWSVLGVPVGEYELCYTAVDWCNNTYTSCITLVVADNVPPIPVCEQFKQVSLTPLGDAKVYAEDFDSGSFDNCGPVWFKVLRGYEYDNNNELQYDGGCEGLNGDDNPFAGGNQVWFDDDVFFCCEDLGQHHPDGIMVTLRVFDVDPGPGPVDPKRMYSPNGDLYGRYNDCWSVVEVECKIPPLVNAPDLEVSCEANLDPEVNTALFPDIVSVCGYTYEYEDSDKRGDVCTGYIQRTWTVTGCDKTVTKVQRIYLTATEPFDPCTISFPADETNIVCPDVNGDPGEPTWEEYPCNIVTAEIVNIDTFKFVDGACMKIVVDWAVVDWCVYEPNTGAEDNLDAVRNRRLVCNELVEDGYYRYTQILMVTDVYSPEIAVEDQCIATTTGCYAENVVLEATATDSCNVDEKFWWKYIVVNMDTWETVQYSYNYTPKPDDGRQGSKSKDNLGDGLNGAGVKDARISILDPLPIGNYRVEWTAGDGCGNATSTYQYFTVADKKPPTPLLVDISTALMSNGMVELTARFFDKGACNDQCLASYDACSDVIYFTFTPMLPAIDNTWKFDIANGVYYFNPETGQEANRNAYLAGTAHSWDPFMNTAGKVFDCDDAPAVNVDVYVWDEFALNEDCNDGNYDFATILLNLNDDNDCPDGLPYVVSGMITDNNSGDGIANVEVSIDKEGNIEYPKYTNTDAGAYAFDVNNGDYTVTPQKRDDYLNGVTTLDLVLIQKYLLGLITLEGDELIAADANANGGVSAADLLSLRELILGIKSELANNDSWVFVPGSSDVTVDGADQVVNFGGIKVGDVNGSANALEPRSNNSINLVVDEAAVEAGMVEVAFTAENFTDVYGGQFTLNVNGMQYAGVEAGALNVTDANFGLVRDGIITMSWNNAEGTSVSNGTVLFTLKLDATQAGSLSNMISASSDVTAAQAYTTENLDINTIDVTFRGAETVAFELFQNEPNPFAESTVIGFNLAEAGNYTLTVFDVTGKVVKVVTNEGQKGYNNERLDRNDISAGVMYYQLESGEYTATKKMIIIE